MKKKQISAIFIAVLFGGSFLAYALNYAMPSQRQAYSRALIEVRICGEARKLPQVTKRIDNSTFTSNSTGLITFPSDIKLTLKEVFNLMNVSFSRNKIMGYKNGNECNTIYTNTVEVFTGKENEKLSAISKGNYETYIVENGDLILVRYS